ncbi:MAG: phosphoglycerate kinase [Candidatus Staskawiczbacteria bacterium]|nr:phosphoglycerate kinase [Candidatus Staskawiczbacteria bacterium]
MKTLKNFSVTGKRILVRCDFNVPVDKKGNILDDFRIKKTLPTIEYLVEEKAKIILMSHLGEPGGKIVPELKMDKIAERLSEYLGFSVEKTDDCIGPEIESTASALEDGGVLLLENLRFHEEETNNDSDFARKLSYLGDIYVNDAFLVCHRDHASIIGVPQLLIEHCAGLLLNKEIESLDRVIINPEKPMIAIIGGKKVETKSKFIDNISKIADFVIISGLIAKEVEDKNIKFKFPEKIIIPNGKLGALDINDESIKIFQEKIATSKTIIWNGPFGKFEEEKYAKGTLAIVKAIINSGSFSVVGGGETVEFLEKQGMIDKFSHVSTGGGAMLSYLAGDKLPGLEVLNGN